jgi:integrase
MTTRSEEEHGKPILESCQIEYRSPYNLRHTAISHALHNGANYIALAEQTGHDKRMMLSTYAHAIGSECLGSIPLFI